MDDFRATDPRLNSLPNVEPVVRWFQAYSKGAMTVGDEMRRFVRDQVQRNLDVWAVVTAQASPTKVAEAHEKWVASTVQDCVTESQRLLSIGGEMLTTLFHQDSEAVRNMTER
jgi:hypothetical protein